MRRLRTLLRPVRLALRRVRLALFGNDQPLWTNALYLVHDALARRRWRAAPAPEAAATARHFAEHGYALLPPQLAEPELRRLAAEIDAAFTDDAGTRRVDDGTRRLMDAFARVPALERLVAPAVERAVEAFFRSHFKIYSVTLYRTEPTAAADDRSFLWHVDNCPPSNIKLMVYLDDVAEETGAIRFKPLPVSADLLRRGFWDRADIDRFRAELDAEATTRVVEAPLGTGILFMNGGCLHKATYPRTGHRDVVTFVLQPSLAPWRENLRPRRAALDVNSGFCRNPFTDRPQHVGQL
jgi:hypothetical protein